MMMRPNTGERAGAGGREMHVEQSIGGVLASLLSICFSDGLFILLGYRVSRSPLKSFCPSQEQRNEHNGGVVHGAESECTV